MATPDGIYAGTMTREGVSKEIVLTIKGADDSLPANNIGQTKLLRGGTEFDVSGTFIFGTLEDTGPVVFRLTASPVIGFEPMYFISLRSIDRSYSVLEGELEIDRGVGQGEQYKMVFNKNIVVKI
ncbi:hypothetical protein [Pseudomonas sp. DR48]|uniref:hypothetical protein n=1 Tax=Pseudomonas sp. DR48 TaxID=2871095 RepID=UPI001C98FBC5|nr:hypothetical protein [Pseudomonas sp. DR48]QZP34037.1 hypothetical protein K5K95_06505 [Pseudomonas sp. DR48]